MSQCVSPDHGRPILPAMNHAILLGDSVFADAAYIGGGPDVSHQLQHMLPAGDNATLLARDGAVIAGISEQLRVLPSDASHLVISVGGNDALRESHVLESGARSEADALLKLAAVSNRFGSDYDGMLNKVGRLGLPTCICTIYEPRYPEAQWRRLAATALAVLNDKITRQAFAR
jgi:hypothetical protein